MQLAELSARSGVSVPSIKYYLRERLLPPGVRDGRSRADYDAQHVERLRLIRALVEIGGLPIARVRAVLETLDSQPDSLHAVFGTAMEVADPQHGLDLTRAEALVRRLGWTVAPDCASMLALAHALEGLDAAGFALGEGHLLELGRRLEPLAELEVDSVPVDSPADALRYVVLGTILVRPVLLALRELALQDASARRFAVRHRREGTTPAPVRDSRA